LGFVAPLDGVLNVWVGPVDDPSAARPVTSDTGRGVWSYAFCHDDRTLVYLQDVGGDEDWRLSRVDLETGTTHLVTPQSGVQAQILAHTRWHPGRMLVGLNDREPQWHDVWELDLATGAFTLVETNPGYADWLVDSDLRIRGGESITSDGGAVVCLRDESGRDSAWRQVAPEDVAGEDVVGFPRVGGSLLLLSSRGAEASRLLRVDIASGEEQVLAADDRYDVATAVLHPQTLEPQAALVVRQRVDWTYLDDDLRDEVEALRSRLTGEVGIARSERSGRLWLVTESPSDGPVRYSLYERPGRQLRFLFSHQPALETYQLAPMEPFEFPARDGLAIEGYVTFPLEVERRALPAVLDVHGGPWVRDRWGYAGEVQWLANRGYVVVQVNYRGSTGYGKAFTNAGDKQWGRAMHTDLLDAVDAVVSRGWVDPGRVAIMGGSYGGYAALAGAAFSPDVFRCAVDLVGPSNLLTLLTSLPEYWKPHVAFMHAKVGDPGSEHDDLWARSPLSRVDDIRIPVLVAQGANDPRVKQAEAEQIVAALRDKGLPHDYLLFDDEGHGLARPANRERFYAATEAFLASHLGGRSEAAT
jgi:dipeptidyl aminopeptidase/acylaminoacyl peptidase